MNDNIQETTFYELINERVNRGMSKANSQIYRALNDRGCKVSERTIRAYREGYRVPRFFVAKEITKILDIDISDDDLQDILDYSRQVYKSKNENESSISGFDRTDNIEKNVYSSELKVNVNINNLEIAADDDLKTEILYERIIDLFGEQDRVDEYVSYLIEKDLNENA